jgi:hypothetical protein
MISPTPVSAAALMTGCLRASRPGHQHLPSRSPRPGFVFFSAISAPWGTYSRWALGRSDARRSHAVHGRLRPSVSHASTATTWTCRTPRAACTFVTMPVPSRPRAERFTRVEGCRSAAPKLARSASASRRRVIADSRRRARSADTGHRHSSQGTQNDWDDTAEGRLRVQRLTLGPAGTAGQLLGASDVGVARVRWQRLSLPARWALALADLDLSHRRSFRSVPGLECATRSGVGVADVIGLWSWRICDLLHHGRLPVSDDCSLIP